MTAKGILYVVSTPIGNMEDITFRAVRVLTEVDLIAAEDTRVTAKLAARYDIETKIVSIRGKSAGKNCTFVLNQLQEGHNAALVTDAGTPSVSDPGLEIVARASACGILVSPVPGPSALAAAVSVAGLSGEGVRFLGFLPRDGRRRKEIIASIRTENALTVLYESPRRTGETLRELAEVCGERQGAVLRELTKVYEEIARDTLTALAERFRDSVRGEVTVAVEGARSTAADEAPSGEDLRAIIAKELNEGRSVKDIAASLSKGLGLSRKVIYALAIEESAARHFGKKS
jgi:16S rRNA (cytidine1402-2'-O)-methyltransferase